MAKNTIHAHTALRGIAAVLVMLYHYRQAWPHGSWLDARTAIFISAEYMVDLFFMLSGFIIARTYLPRAGRGTFIWRDYFQSRMARIYPLHVATLVFMIGLSTKFGTVSDSLWNEIWRSALLIQSWGFQDRFTLNYPSWSISAEVAAYLLFPLLALGYLRYGKRCLLPVVALACVALGVHDFLIAEAGLRWERLTLLRAVPGFVIGVFLYIYDARIRTLPNAVLTWLQLATVLAIVLTMHVHAERLALIPLLALLISTTSDDRGLIGRWLGNRDLLHQLGDLSYSLYMLHVPVLYTGYIVWPKLSSLLPIALREELFVPACIFLTVALASLIYRYFEMPLRNALRPRVR